MGQGFYKASWEFVLKVLFLSELFYPHGGGAEFATYLYAKLLSERDVNVIVVTNRFSGEREFYRTRNLTVYRLPLTTTGRVTKYSTLNPRILLSSHLRKLIKNCDVLYVPRFWFSSIPIAKMMKKPVVLHLHDYIISCPLSNLYDAFNRRICGGNRKICGFRCIYTWERMLGGYALLEPIISTMLNATSARLWRKAAGLSDAIVCVSNKQRAIVTRDNTSLELKTSVIYNPLPHPKFSKIEGHDFGYFGGPSYIKGFNILCKAIKRIQLASDKRAYEAPIVHATNFKHADTESLIGNSCYDSFKFHGRLTEEKFELLYKQICCVVVPSIWHETFSYVVAEALLRGRVVVASKIGAIPEVSRGCPGIYLFQPGDSDDLASKLSHVKNLDEKTLDDLGVANREVTKKRFSNENALNRFLKLLKSVSEGTH